MKAIEILRKSVARKHPCDSVHSAIDEIESLIKDAIIIFNANDFDRNKEDWLKRANQ